MSLMIMISPSGSYTKANDFVALLDPLRLSSKTLTTVRLFRYMLSVMNLIQYVLEDMEYSTRVGAGIHSGLRPRRKSSLRA